MKEVLNAQPDQHELLRARLEYVEMLEQHGYIYTISGNTVSICDQDNNPVYVTKFVIGADSFNQENPYG